MRLHRLTVTAFGPFGATSRVDFDELTAAGLFLLHGATGAGKTSVLDAVCYALYDGVPGARQQPGDALRSHHAEPGTPTEVVLDLTVAGRRLEITRRPQQLRPKRSGTGLTRERAQSELREYDAARGAWKALSRSHQEIGEEITQLLGMSRDQFCQVVLLPQGDFARFLRAGAEDRAKLLGRLFDTGRFAAVEEQLARMRRDAQEAVRSGDDELRALAHRIRQAAGDEPGPDDEPPPGGAAGRGAARTVPDQRSHRDRTADRPGPGTGAAGGADREPEPAEAVLTRAAVARAGARERLDIARIACRTAEQRHADAERRLEECRELDRQQRRFADARRRSAELAAQETQRRETAARLERARAAQAVAPVLALRDTCAAEHAEAAAHESACRDALPDDLAAADADRLTRLEHEVRQELGGLEAARRAERRSADVTGELAVLERESRAEDDAQYENAEWLAGWDETRRAHRQRVDDAQEAATRAEQLAGRLGPARRRLEAARRRDTLEGEAAAAGEELLRAREAAAAARDHWLDLKERRLLGAAAELAAGLREGEPCAVCGSTEHPEPAPLAPDHVDRHTEEAALAEHRTAEAAREAADRRLNALREQLTAARAESGEDGVAALADAARELETAHAQAHAAAGDGHAAREALERAEREYARRLDEQRAAERRAAARASRREALLRERAALAEELDRARGTAAGVAERAAALERHAARLGEAAAAARTAADTGRRLADADARLADAVRSAAFASAEDARGAVLDESGRRALQDRLDSWQAEEAAVAAVLADPQAARAAQHPPADPEAARAAVEEATRLLRAASAAETAAATRCAELDRLGARASEEVCRTAPLRRTCERVTGLATLAAGTSAENARKMRLETYVLAARLEQVAAAASARLSHMSGGRYTLVHSAARASGRGRSGLGLHVVDSWTGVERDTATLSGGETFFASLALALGLADVVTDEAGGTRLDTLFIDEGFGSLDEQTLDEVLDVLDSLRERDRSVGIVSHVPDLRRRIPAQLEVIKSRAGSTLRRRTAPLGG